MNGDESMLAVQVSANDHAQGDTTALVTLVEYGDYQCPACAMAYPVVKQIQRRYAGNLRFVFRNFPMSQVHPFARWAAEVAEGAATLDRFWPMHDWLYENQDSWAASGPEGLQEGLRELGIEEAAIAQAIREPDIDARIRNDFMGGARSGVNGTPSFFINGQLHQNDFGSLARAIGNVIAKHC
jgi:protein-disulfide isomerase